MADTPTGTPTVTDHRTPPRGTLPRGTQAWLMVALAILILGIIVITGRSRPVSRTAARTTIPAGAPSPERLRDYQDRLRVLDERARQQPVTATPAAPAVSERAAPRRQETAADALAQERTRREYDSLFATNVVLSRRADSERLSTIADPRLTGRTPQTGVTTPSLDEVADAVVRASARHVQTPAPPASMTEPHTATAPQEPNVGIRPTPPMAPTGPLYRLVEGTLIDTVLTNRLDGTAVAPINCLVTSPAYSHDGRVVLIPAGSRVLGETRPVQAFGETRLAVAFHRLVLPDGRTHPLEHFLGLNAIGDAGLRDQVNQHYRSTFGASAAIGLLTGFAQLVGSAAFGRNTGTIVIAGGTAESTAQATSQTMNRFLNRLPTITIREGHRVKVYVTTDLELPAYTVPRGHTAPLAGGR